MANGTRLGETGNTGLETYGGNIHEEWHRSLRGSRGAKQYREMRDNNAVIGSSMLLIQSLLRQTKWSATPAETPRGEEAAEFLTSSLNDMDHTWADFTTEVMSMLWFGWVYFEKVFEVKEAGNIGWKKFSIRGQESLESWGFSDKGELTGMWQNPPPSMQRVFIPIEKAMLFRTETAKNNPEGRSMLRNAYRSYHFLKRMQEIEAIGTERDLVGMPFARLPLAYLATNAPPAKKAVTDAIFKSIKNLRRNEQEGIIFPAAIDNEGNPTGFEFNLLSTGGRRSLDISGAIIRYEKRIAMTLLTQFLLLGMDRVGSFSLSSDMTSMFTLSLGAMLDSMQSTFNKNAVEELLVLNGFDKADATWTHGDLEKEDMVRFAGLMTSLVGADVLQPDAKLEDFIRDKYDLPDAERTPAEDEDVFGADRLGVPDEDAGISQATDPKG